MKIFNSISFKLFLFVLLIFLQNHSKAQKIGEFHNAVSFSAIEGGAFFILDKGTSEVIKIDSGGTVLKKIGGTGWDDYTFDNPTDLSASMLRVYVTDRNNSRIQVYDYELNFLFSLDSKKFSASKASFRYPVSSAASPYGDLYIADSDEKQILKFNSKWEWVSSFANNEYGKYAAAFPLKISVDGRSNIYLLDGSRILQFDQFGNGKQIIEMKEKVKNIRAYDNLLFIIYDESLAISDFSNGRGKRIPFGLITSIEGGTVNDIIPSGDKLFILTDKFISVIPNSYLE